MNGLRFAVTSVFGLHESRVLDNRFHHSAEREHWMFLVLVEDKVDRRLIDSSNLLQEATHFCQVELAQKFEVYALAHAVDEFQEILDEDRGIERVEPALELITDLLDRTHPDLVPVDELFQ